MLNFSIPPITEEHRTALQQRIDRRTKPLGALGQLESLALQIGLIQNQTDRLTLKQPTLLVFAADHGIAPEGVSAYPADITPQMVRNFLRGGAAINVFCRQHGIEMQVIDAGVNDDFEAHPGLVNAKMGYGTTNFLKEPAMRRETAKHCLQRGAELAQQAYERGSNVIGLGEMGIGNTSSAAVITSVLGQLPLAECTGRGTGLDDASYRKKLDILTQAVQRHGTPTDPLDALATYGGFEIAQMCGAMLQAASQRMIVLVDGFIASAAFLVAHALHPEIRPYAVFCHQSQEAGHAHLLRLLGAKPLLHLGLRLGEGTGCALAYPLLVSAIGFYNEMASFDQMQ